MDQIMTREAWFNRGADAARRGDLRDEHHMNWHAPAIAEWQAGHDYVTNARAKQGGHQQGGQP